MDNFSGQTILITGGGLGIGKCIALAFAKAKANVFICSRTTKDLDQTLSEIAVIDGKGSAQVVDVSQQEQVQNWVDSIQNSEGKIDVLINNAGVYGPIGLLEENNLAEWEKAIKVNLFGTVFATQSVLPHMKKRKRGKIINVAGAGVGSANLMPNFSAYISSKAAVIGFTEAMALELKQENIQINAISPGAVNTRFLAQVLNAGERAGRQYFVKAQQQEKEGGVAPELAAKLALFLASEKSNFITGKTISARWDDYDNFSSIREAIENSSYLNLRRIDNFSFHEEFKK